MARAVVGILLGILAGIAAIACLELIDSFLFPPPFWLEISNREAMRAYTEGLPFGAQALVAAGWFAGALAGGAIAFLVARRGWTIWTIAALDAAASLADVATFPHPLFLRIAALAAPLLGGLAAAAIIGRRRDPGRAGAGKGENGG
jgi:hypothetical protein